MLFLYQTVIAEHSLSLEIYLAKCMEILLFLLPLTEFSRKNKGQVSEQLFWQRLMNLIRL